MLQLRYWLPRLIILGTLCLGIWVSSTTLARWAVKKYGDETLGSNIEAKDIQINLSEGKISFSDFQLEIPEAEGTVLESDKLTLDFSVSELLRRRLHVDNGRMSNPKVTVDGSNLGGSVGTTLRKALMKPEDSLATRGTSSSNWLSKINRQLGTIDQDLNNYGKYGDSVRLKWLREIESCKKQAGELNRAIALIQSGNGVNVNPLRLNAHRLELTKKVTSLTNRIVTLKSRINQIQNAANTDIALLDKTRKQKEDQFENLADSKVFSASEMDQVLFRELPRHQIENMTAWVDWVLRVVPSIENSANKIQGEDERLTDTEMASLLIKKLELRGVTPVNNRFYRLHGDIKNITDSSNFDAGPTTVEFRAQGDVHVMVSAIFDRKSGKKVISVKVPASTQDEMDVNSFANEKGKKIDLEISPSRVFADLRVVIEGDKVSGSLSYQHTSAEMKVLSEGLDKEFESRISENISYVRSFDRKFRFGGSKESLNVVHSSTLGAQLSLGLNDAVEAYVAENGQQRLDTVVSRINKESQELKTLIGSRTREVLQSVQTGMQRVANLQQGSTDPGRNRRRLR